MCRRGFENITIIAGGCSFNQAQASQIQAAQDSGKTKVITVNSSFQAIARPDIIYACDRRWWVEYINKLPAGSEKYSGDQWAANAFNLSHMKVLNQKGLSTTKGILYSGKNSGYQAINLAYHLGAKTIVLAGFDMQKTGKIAHWHGNHPAGFSNADGIQTWIPLFEALANDLQLLGVNVLNCSNETAIPYFKRAALGDVYESF